jgi:hypothetical protein
MSRLLRLLRPGVVALLPLLFLPLRAAEAPPPPAEETQPAAEAATPAAEPPAASERAPAAAEEVEEAPLEPISADNNLTFPVDI